MLLKLQLKLVDVYRLAGTLTTVALTLATLISMSNVFSYGVLIKQSTFVPGLWAFVYSASIDVNVVRLFIESSIEWSINRLSSVIDAFIASGLGGCVVAALYVESLQSSLHLQWSDPLLLKVISFIVFVRVIFVFLLMAREGICLGQAVVSTFRSSTRNRTRLHTDTVNPKNERDPIIANQADTSDVIDINTFKDDKLMEILTVNPNISSRELAKHLHCSNATAAKRKREWIAKQSEEVNTQDQVN